MLYRITVVDIRRAIFIIKWNRSETNSTNQWNKQKENKSANKHLHTHTNRAAHFNVRIESTHNCDSNSNIYYVCEKEDF